MTTVSRASCARMRAAVDVVAEELYEREREPLEGSWEGLSGARKEYFRMCAKDVIERAHLTTDEEITPRGESSAA